MAKINDALVLHGDLAEKERQELDTPFEKT
jgi:hypothetical protein